MSRVKNYARFEIFEVTICEIISGVTNTCSPSWFFCSRESECEPCKIATDSVEFRFSRDDDFLCVSLILPENLWISR